MEPTGKKTKVIEDFVTKQLELLKEESRAEAQRFQLEYHTFSAKAESTEDDDEVGCLVNFVSLSQEKLKKGDRITTGEKKKAKQGYIQEISSKGFKLSVRKRGTFIIGQEYKFSQAMQRNTILQDAMVDLHSSEVFKPGESNTRMRDLLLGLAKPRTLSKQHIKFLNPALDTSQREAVISSLAQEDLSIIHGPPGTGKTTTLVEIIQQTVKLGGRVLVCSASHAAVDNLMARLVGVMNKGIIRIGHPAKMDKKHVKYTLPCMVRKKKKPQAQVLADSSVVFGTLTGCGGDSLVAKLVKGHFSLTVVDECGQAMEAAVWGVVRYTSKLLLAGDHLQLPPTILSQKPKVKDSLSISLMERLAGVFQQHPLVQLLDTQYRMNSTIMAWSSNTFYKGRLKAANTVAEGRLGDLKGVKVEGMAPAILLVNTGGRMGEQSSRDVAKSSLANPGEAEIIVRTVRELVARGVRPRNIGVISFYALQVDLIRHNLSSLHPEVEVNSVDGFQGQEREVILLSTVRSNNKNAIGFLKEPRRLNVAVTRAKKQLVVVSDVDTFRKDNVFKSFFDYIKISGDVSDAVTFGKPVKIEIPTTFGLTKIKIQPTSLVDEGAPELSKVQKAVTKMINGQVIVGHSLDHNFQVLQLDHPEEMVRDTAEYEPFKAVLHQINKCQTIIKNILRRKDAEP